MFQPDLLKGKRVLITGGGTGLGKSMGRRMIELGAELMICGRRAQVLKDTAKEFEDSLSCKVRTHVIDIRSAEAVDGLMDAAFADGPLDVVPSAMAKAGVLAMTRSLAVEWGPKGIRTVAISPGSFPTKGAWDRLVPPSMAQRWESLNPLGRAGEHGELANLAAYLVSDQAGYINGDCITIDGGRWLQGASMFSHLSTLGEADWQEMRAR